MLSDRIIRLITLRLAIIKYAGNAAFSWDIKKERMTTTNNYIFWTWCNSYYFGIVATPILIVILYRYMEEENDRLNSGDDTPGNNMKNIAMCILFTITCLLIFCSLAVSILKASRKEICAFYYACFDLDKSIKETFTSIQVSLEPVRKSFLKYELIMALTCVASLFAPALCFVSIYHPVDPLRTFLKDGFEIEVKPSILIFVLSFLYAWSALAMANTFITFIFTALFTITTCIIWTFATMPVASMVGGKFLTEQLGTLDCDHVLRIYRYHQVLCNYMDAIIAKFRMALHFGILHVLFIMSSYLLIRNGEMYLEQGGYDLIGLSMVLIFFSVFICKMECAFVGTMVEVSKSIIKRIISLSNRRHYAFKTARSFRILVVRTTYPLFTVSNETYLEFWNVSVDHIVNLLCL